MSDSWKVSFPCTRAEAEMLKEDLPALALLDAIPVLMTSEPDPTRPEEWRLDAYFEGQPSAADVERLKALVPSAADLTPTVEPLQQQDWVTLSQQGLEPIRAGRFFVHTPAHRDRIPADAVAFEIDAGRAFGTGHHETTTGCLLALDSLKASGRSFANIVDVGTGTGLLAFAALALWPSARAIASDIDPISIDVTAENAALNGIRLGRGHGRLELAVAAGLRHHRLKARAPYDLIIANILAAPLIELAPSLSAALETGGYLILAGLLDTQAPMVTAAYRRHGLMLVSQRRRGDWPAVVMRKRRQLRRPSRGARTPAPGAAGPHWV